MKFTYQPPNPGKRFRQSPADRPERPDHRIRGILGFVPGIGVLLIVVRCRIIDEIARWHRRRTTIRALRDLNDYYLKDIGLDRSQIEATVEEMIDETIYTCDRRA
ncbi:DUF1127 domain-containing protein [Pelagibius sp. Alg239-R121]|uniref:DUF1127 domain-containing protein n=1 Tax=Pelagibius sp. Alg239-R121 TaxID=2993448 RepID=UPI0024A68797|nr:DUF1127 domain-containing protein [Pelagibius sp. Alg239-R121]